MGLSIVSLDRRSDSALFKQLRRSVIADIHAGRLAPGEVLPPVPEVAAQLEVDVNTVGKAWHDLKVMKYIRRTPKGMCVIPLENGAQDSYYEVEQDDSLARLQYAVSECRALGIAKSTITNVLKG